jgi:hypothetical protein
MSITPSVDWSIGINFQHHFKTCTSVLDGSLLLTGIYDHTQTPIIYNSDSSVSSIEFLNTSNQVAFIIKYSSAGVALWRSWIEAINCNISTPRLLTNSLGHIYLVFTVTDIIINSNIVAYHANGSASSLIFNTENTTSAIFICKYNYSGQAFDTISIQNAVVNMSCGIDNQDCTFLSGFFKDFADTIVVYGRENIRIDFIRTDPSKDTLFTLKLSSGGTPIWMATVSGFVSSTIETFTNTYGITFIPVEHNVTNQVIITDNDFITVGATNQLIINNSNPVSVSNAYSLAPNISTFLSVKPGMSLLKLSAHGTFAWATTITNARFEYGAIAASDFHSNPYLITSMLYNYSDIKIYNISSSLSIGSISIPSSNRHTAILKLDGATGLILWTSTINAAFQVGGCTVDAYNNLVLMTNNTTTSVLHINNADNSEFTTNYIATPSITLTQFSDLGICKWSLGPTTISNFAHFAGASYIGNTRDLFASFAFETPLTTVVLTNGDVLTSSLTSLKIIRLTVPLDPTVLEPPPQPMRPFAHFTLGNPFNIIFSNQNIDDVLLYGNNPDEQKLLIGMSNGLSNASICVTKNNVKIEELTTCTISSCNITVSENLTIQGNINAQSQAINCQQILCNTLFIGGHRGSVVFS